MIEPGVLMTENTAFVAAELNNAACWWASEILAERQKLVHGEFSADNLAKIGAS